ncbi:MAG TPA: type IV secretion system DNA-binding domain-containing protein, partial [Gammaproteobacteria bacterium]|nr:type IV secretion system DNA-binding domain-containing protein [Gammaproteobacteria bacterium]
MRNYIRGGQIALHFYRMFRQINGTVLTVAAVAFLGASAYLIHKKTTSYEREMGLHYYFAELHQSISGGEARYQFKDPEGQRVTLKVAHFLVHPSVRYYKARCIKGIQASLIESGIYTGLGVVLFVIGLTTIGHLQKRQRLLRGSAFVTPRALRKYLRKNNKASDIEIAKTPLAKDAEMQHILLTGTTGTGKSICMLELMDNIRRRGERAIV